MLNVKPRITGAKLVIEVDISPEVLAGARPSTTKRTRIIATTAGHALMSTIDGELVTFILNVWTDPVAGSAAA